MSYGAAVSVEGQLALFAPLTHHQPMQFVTAVQPHGLGLLLQSLIPVQLTQVGQVRFWKGVHKSTFRQI